MIEDRFRFEDILRMLPIRRRNVQEETANTDFDERADKVVRGLQTNLQTDVQLVSVENNDESVYDNLMKIFENEC